MYEVNWTDVVVAHDQHPHYASTAYAFESPARERVAVQHHRAHIASMLAERGALDTRLRGAAFDGIGCGDDGKIWGGEFLVGSVSEGFCRVASLRPYALAVATRRHGGRFRRRLGSFFDDDEQPDLAPAPFNFPKRYDQALRLARGGFRTFTSIIEARNVHFLHVAQPCLPASGRVFSPRCVNGGSRHDLRDYDEMNEAYRGRVGDNPPVHDRRLLRGNPGRFAG
jgi:hypothetical protein